MAGQMGNAKTTVQNLTIMKVDEEKNLLIISGSVPGPKNGFLIVEK
jgi:large subunit ribosomal protein L3